MRDQRVVEVRRELENIKKRLLGRGGMWVIAWRVREVDGIGIVCYTRI